MVVSALAASQGNPGLALGNAYGSNITNIALILGLTALISPIAVASQVVRKEIPILLGITLLSGALLLDGHLDRTDAVILGVVFVGLMGWSIRAGMRGKGMRWMRKPRRASTARDVSQGGHRLAHRGAGAADCGLPPAGMGAVTIAQALGISDLVIGLTIVAVGTSLPELASSLIAIRKNEHDLALGNVLGSNLFNTLAVVGIAAGIHPLDVAPEVLSRDWSVMMGLTLLLLVMCLGRKGQGRINRLEGACCSPASSATPAGCWPASSSSRLSWMKRKREAMASPLCIRPVVRRLPPASVPSGCCPESGCSPWGRS